MASTASQVQRQGQEGGDRGDSVTMSIWCHVCNQQEVVSGSSSENERDQQTNIVCPSCGSDFIEIVGNTRRLGTVASGGVLRGNIHHEAAEARTRRVDFESLEGLLSSNNSNNNNNGNTNDNNILRTANQSDAANTATGASGDSAVRASAAIRAGGEGGGGVGSRAGYHFLHGPISVRVETRGAPGVGVPQLLQSLFSAGGLSSLGVDLGHSGVQAGDFVFGGNDALERIIAQLAENHVAASVPASPQVISKLRRIRCKKELQGCSAEGCTAEECSICQEGYEGEFTAIQMPCSHVFHEECLLQWLKEQNTCPICRLKLPSAASEAEERERVETDRLARTSTPDMVQRARAASVGLTGDLSGNTSSSSDEEMLRRMNDIDEEPPTSMEGVFMGAGEAEAEAEAEQERSGSDLEHRSNKGFRGVGFHVGHLMKRLAPLGNVLKWASKPLGRVVKLGVCLTDKLLGK